MAGRDEPEDVSRLALVVDDLDLRAVDLAA
jgi:hypothetical protein